MSMLAIGIGGAAVGAAAGGLSASSANSQAARNAAITNAPYQAVVNQGESLMDQPYQAYTGQLVAPETGNEMAASTLATQTQGAEAGDLSMASQQWNAGTMQQYMNPYIQSAINVPEQQLALNYGQQEAALARKQSMTDAFGVGRSAAQQGVLNRNYETEFGNIQATGMAQAYNAAQGAFQQDTSRYARLAQETGALDTQNINSLLTTGQNERSIEQAQDTANYQQFKDAQNWGLQRYMDTAGQITGAASHEVVPQKSSVLGGILGGALSGVGAVMGFGGGGGGGGGGGNPGNLGGSTPVASPGGSLQYDADGNIIGGAPLGITNTSSGGYDSTGYDGGGQY